MKSRPAKASAVDLGALSLTQLALFVGQAADEHVLTQLQSDGFLGVRPAHGYVVQHLLQGPRSIGELGKLLGISQQAASKSVTELVQGGYAEAVDSDDARVRRVQLSERGYACVQKARSVRKRLDERLARRVGSSEYQLAHRVLLEALEALGGSDAVRSRRVRPAR